jgi:hypothetical protein
MPCCFNRQVPIQVLVEDARAVVFRGESDAAPRIVVTLTCVHGSEYRHVSYRGATDWTWCLERLIAALDVNEASATQGRGAEHVGLRR